MSSIALSKVLEVAENEVGYLEKRSNSNLDSKTGNAGSNNYTKYWRDLGYNGYQGQPWCQAFVDWCYMKAYGEKAAKRLLYQSAWEFYTPSGAGYFKNAGRWHSTPKAGDIIYFRNTQRICHVGIVRKVADGVVYTIEGNTSNGSSVVANGGGVCKKSYLVGNSRIAGYGRPAYTDVNTGSKTIARGQRNANKFLTSPTIATDGIAGPNTRRQCGRVLQHALNREYGCDLAVDGIVGEKTKAALKNRTIRKGDKSYLVLAAKILYQCAGKDKGLKYSRAYGSGLVKTAGKEKIVEKDLLSLL